VTRNKNRKQLLEARGRNHAQINCIRGFLGVGAENGF
jgi:hypothetical protein